MVPLLFILCVYSSHSYQKQNGDSSGGLAYHSSTIYLNGQLRPLTWSETYDVWGNSCDSLCRKKPGPQTGKRRHQRSSEEVQGANAADVEVGSVRADVIVDSAAQR